MGLKAYRKYRAREDLLEILTEFGITRTDLFYLHDALAIVKELKEKSDKTTTNHPFKLSEEQEKKIKEKSLNKITPQQILEMFGGEVEDIYPNEPKEKENH